MVGHVVLHVPVIARTLAEVGRLGSPRSTEHVRVSTGARFSVEDPIWALGPHDVALSLRMMGRAPIAVRARRDGASIVAAARFSNGAESRFRFSRAGQAPLRRVDVAGDGYHLTADEASGRLISRSPAGSRDELVAGELTPLDLECRQFVQCVLGQTRPLEPLSDARMVITRADGSRLELVVTLRIDTAIEVAYYRHGGILPFVLRQLLG